MSVDKSSTGGSHMKNKKLNAKNCYLIIVTILAITSLLGNVAQDHFYNKALNIQQDIIVKLTDENKMIMMNTAK